jgi:hypothetical protein
MPIVLRQDVQLARLISRIEHGANRAKQIVRGISDEALVWRPPEGGWGIGHYLEHAIATADPHLEYLPPVIKKGVVRHRFAKNGRWKVSLRGGIVRWTIGASPRSLRLARMPTPGADVVKRFLARQKEVGDLLRSADGLRLDRIHCRMGGLVWWRLADACTLLVTRTERDLAGAREVREHPDFPVNARQRSEVKHRD